MNIIHVIPLNDLQEHSEEVKIVMGWLPFSKCACMAKSQLDPDSGGWIIIHGAFDGREALEEANEILGLSNKK